MSDDEGYSGEELIEDVRQLFPLLSVVYHYFANNTHGEEAKLEAMMDGLGYIYFCRKWWHTSTLLMSLETDLRRRVRSRMVGPAVQEFWQVAEEPLTAVIRAFLRQRNAGRNN